MEMLQLLILTKSHEENRYQFVSRINERLEAMVKDEDVIEIRDIFYGVSKFGKIESVSIQYSTTRPQSKEEKDVEKETEKSDDIEK